MSKIIFFEYIHHFGGAQRSSIDVISNLIRLGNDVIVIDPIGDVDDFKIAVEHSGSKYISFGRNYNFKRKFNFLGLLSFFKACLYYILDVLYLLYYIKKINPNIVFTNSIKAILPIICVSAVCKFKKYFFVRGINNNKLSIFMKIILNKLTDRVFVQANKIQLYLIENGINKSKIKIVRNAISDKFYYAKFVPEINIAQYDTKKIAIVSTVIPTKGYSELMNACCKLKKSNINFMLFVIGDFLDKDYECYVRKKIQEYNISENVQFLGHRDDVGDILMAIDIFVLPSYAEGTPRSVLEAMVLGKAVIASNVGGVSDCIEDGKTGLLIPAKDSELLYKCLDLLINNTDVATELGKNAKEFIRANFTMENQKQLLSKEFI